MLSFPNPPTTDQTCSVFVKGPEFVIRTLDLPQAARSTDRTDVQRCAPGSSSYFIDGLCVRMEFGEPNSGV